jgi:hypothetical protein
MTARIFFGLIRDAGYEAQSVAYMSERPGLLALDQRRFPPCASADQQVGEYRLRFNGLSRAPALLR